MNLVLCDDEKLFLDSLYQKITSWAKVNGHTDGIMLRSFTSSEDMLEAWRHGMSVDALFMDIQIPGEMNGLAVAKEIHSLDENVPIIFVTSYGEYAEDGYEVNALRYIRKPISEHIIFNCMDVLWHRWSLRHTKCVVIELPTQILRLPVDYILYVEVTGHYCLHYTTGNCKKYRIQYSLDALRKKLPSNLFIQCHRSYIVNLIYIRNISKGCITMANGQTIQIGRNYQTQLIHMFRQYYLGG